VLDEAELANFSFPSDDIEKNKKIFSDRINYSNNLMTIISDIET
jgi:hypothetical protein